MKPNVKIAYNKLRSKNRYHLPYNAKHLKGKTTLYLKNSTSKQYGKNNFCGKTIRKVQLIVKSANSDAIASVYTKKYGYEDYRVIQGNEEHFKHRTKHFQKINLPIQEPLQMCKGEGVFQIHLEGSLKVKKVIIRYKEK